jgi:hypothetical protein
LNVVSQFSVLVVLMIICHRKVLFWSTLFAVLQASCTWIGKTFLKFWKFFVIILLNILWILLLGPLLHLQCLWFSGLVFWWSHWVLTYSFHSLLVVCLTVLQFFSLIFILSLSSEILSSTISSLLEWTCTVFFVPVWFPFLRLSMFLVTSSLTFFILLYNSFISLFIVFFVSLWYLFVVPLSSFICFCVFPCSLFLVSWNFLSASCTFWLPCLVSSPWNSQWLLARFFFEDVFVGITMFLSAIYLCFVWVRD